MGSIHVPESGDSLPPFPAGLKEAPITRISYTKIASKDAAESERLFQAVQERSFFYLDFASVHDSLAPKDESDTAVSILTAATALHDVAESAFSLPFEQKDAVSTFKTKSVFGFKAGGQTISKDPQRRVERVEFFNVAKDDIVALSEGREPPTGIQYPPPLVSSEAGLPHLSAFVRNAHPIGMKVLEILAGKLNMSYEDIAERHRFDARSGDDARFTFAPGLKEEGHEMMKEEEIPITTWEHTDYGSLTILFNWLGGLQIINRKVSIYPLFKSVMRPVRANEQTNEDWRVGMGTAHPRMCNLQYRRFHGSFHRW